MEASRALATRVPVAVLGATGYTGVELLRLLARHPAVELAFLSSEQYRDRRARAGLLRGPVIIDAKSGTTGAGRGAKVEQLFAEVNENFRPYAIGEHRHGPEIDQELRAAGAARGALFVPHLLPLSRGLLCTMYVRTGGARPRLAELFQGAYDGEPFVVLRGEDAPPELREVRGTNRCAIGWRWDGASGQAIVVTAIDNLGKGASGQAVQCLNVILDLPETTGLEAPALVP